MIIQSVKTSKGFILLIEHSQGYRIANYTNDGVRKYSFDLPFNQYDAEKAIEEFVEHVVQ